MSMYNDDIGLKFALFVSTCCCLKPQNHSRLQPQRIEGRGHSTRVLGYMEERSISRLKFCAVAWLV